MADNVQLNAGTGGAIASSEEVTTLNGGVVEAQQLQRIIVALRTGNGTAEDVDSDSRIPVADAAVATALASLLTELGQKLEPGDLSTLATSAKQDTLAGLVDGLEGTNAAILAKLIVAPATEAKQDAAATLLTAIDGHVDGLEGKDFATQTTLAALLAKVIAAPATEAKQDTANTSLASILTSVDQLEGYLDTVEALLAVQTTTSATPTAVASSATVVTLKALNTSRRGLTIFNDSTAILHVKLGSAATATDQNVELVAGGYYEMPSPIYTGIVTGIWESANGFAYVAELV